MRKYSLHALTLTQGSILKIINDPNLTLPNLMLPNVTLANLTLPNLKPPDSPTVPHCRFL